MKTIRRKEYKKNNHIWSVKQTILGSPWWRNNRISFFRS